MLVDRAGRRRAEDGPHQLTVDRTLLTARSIEFDALVVAGGTTPTNDIKLVLLLQEAYRHCKASAPGATAAEILEPAAASRSRDPACHLDRRSP